MIAESLSTTDEGAATNDVDADDRREFKKIRTKTV